MYSAVSVPACVTARSPLFLLQFLIDYAERPVTKQANTKPDAPKRSKVSQTEFPNHSLQQAERIAQAIWDNFGGRGAAPHDIAIAIDMSPTSGGWRNLCGSAIAYGLTEGGYAAPQITLTSLGRRIVAPTEEGDDVRARVVALTQPRLQREFFEKYNKAKFPRDDIGRNQLVALGLPKDRSEKAFEILKENGAFAGVLRDTKTGLFVAIDTPIPPPHSSQTEAIDIVDEDEDAAEAMGASVTILGTASRQGGLAAVSGSSIRSPQEQSNKRVFITHGKNKRILDQVKEIVTYGGFEPIVAVERESGAKPVPEKVMADMRTCAAAVIHVAVDEVLFDKERNERPQINGNVLIEIGAAMALYPGYKFILLVEEGLKLPSNLQGLYECRYTGDELSGPATMKLLKAFNEFKAAA
jgi:hypothetical protein